MTKINNLFFFYLLSCIGFGVGNVYWNENYTRYIFIGVSMLIGLFMITMNKDTNKGNKWCKEHLLSKEIMRFLCIKILGANRNAYKVIDLGFYNALIGSLMLWIFTMRYHRNF